jgi:hypothetical protein
MGAAGLSPHREVPRQFIKLAGLVGANYIEANEAPRPDAWAFPVRASVVTPSACTPLLDGGVLNAAIGARPPSASLTAIGLATPYPTAVSRTRLLP